ncbi:MAG: flagellar biosynthesis protein FliQ [Deltaproteobacteria bacterium]|nr:flagellar biosynthesis protein FliQ [Deltaproteobacteria bacterium]MBI3075656.1 flagellar biosynthesis protein FliQ [Deltaproteobacteria bacterium]
MTPDFVIGFGREALEMALLLSAPMLGFALVVSLVVGILQAATQIQEMTLTFVPKIIAMVAALLLFAPWMLQLLVSYTARVLENLPTYVR